MGKIGSDANVWKGGGAIMIVHHVGGEGSPRECQKITKRGNPGEDGDGKGGP